MEKAIYKGIVLDVLGECGVRVKDNGDMVKEYSVKKETAESHCIWRAPEDELIFI